MTLTDQHPRDYMQLVMAPMEGVIDHHMRDLLTGLGGLDGCVTEFVRVSDSRVLPRRAFQKLCPELDHQGLTRHGVPVKLQLLGGDPQTLADNAAYAASLGAYAIDLNFGCPAKTVNNSNGGASLLQYPERVFDIVAAVRRQVPADIAVSAKIRLGFHDRSAYLDNAHAVAAAGATELTVHARSKVDGYQPPAYWDYIQRIREAVTIPVVANGEIWSVDDWRRCHKETGCSAFMLGRGILARPDLALAIRAEIENKSYIPMSWQHVSGLLFDYHISTQHLYPPRFLGNRIKQWLAYLRLTYPQAEVLFHAIKREKDATVFEQKLLIEIAA